MVLRQSMVRHLGNAERVSTNPGRPLNFAILAGPDPDAVGAEIFSCKVSERDDLDVVARGLLQYHSSAVIIVCSIANFIAKPTCNPEDDTRRLCDPQAGEQLWQGVDGRDKGDHSSSTDSPQPEVPWPHQ
jgi:hypothetical protein